MLIFCELSVAYTPLYPDLNVVPVLRYSLAGVFPIPALAPFLSIPVDIAASCHLCCVWEWEVVNSRIEKTENDFQNVVSIRDKKMYKRPRGYCVSTKV
jgi:hypothetical protein